VTDSAYEQRANTILHELAHMWFGDLVTMTWWDDLWLNESFAEWAAHYANVHATRFTDAWTSFSNQRKAWAYRQDQLPSTHPIAADMTDLDAVRVNFDGITYAKGASALRQLVAWVGEPEFLAGIHEYFTKHAWGNTQLDDLLVELEKSSGRDLSGWTQEWLRTSGVNLMRPLIAVDANGNLSRRANVNVGDSQSENDGPESGNQAVPYSVYTLANATFIGRGYNVISARLKAASGAIEPATGANYRDNGSAKVYNSIFMDAPHGALLAVDSLLPGDTTSSSAGNSAINRFTEARTTGGFDAAGRASDLVTAQTGAPGEKDGLFNNVWFFRAGLLDTDFSGVNGKYASLEQSRSHWDGT
jgi:hypothetical protein